MADRLEEKLQRGERLASLYAAYGNLLTDRQKEALRLYFEEDLSLSEIAETVGTTRQNIHETIVHSTMKLEEYESKLGLLQNSEKLIAQLRQVKVLLQSGSYADALESLNHIIRNQEGEDTDNGI